MSKPRQDVYSDVVIRDDGLEFRMMKLRPTTRTEIADYRLHFEDMCQYRSDVEKEWRDFLRRALAPPASVTEDDFIIVSSVLHRYNTECVSEHRTCDEALEDISFFIEKIWEWGGGSISRRKLPRKLASAGTERGIRVDPAKLVDLIDTNIWLLGMEEEDTWEDYLEQYNTVRLYVEKALDKDATSLLLAPRSRRILKYCFDRRRWMYIPSLLETTKEVYEAMTQVLEGGNVASENVPSNDCDAYLAAVHNNTGTILMSLTVWPYPGEESMQEHAFTTGNLREMVEGRHVKGLALALYAYAGQRGNRKHIVTNPTETMRKILFDAAHRGLLKMSKYPRFDEFHNRCMIFGPDLMIENDLTFHRTFAPPDGNKMVFDVMRIIPRRMANVTKLNAYMEHFTTLLEYVRTMEKLCRKLVSDASVDEQKFQSMATALNAYNADCVNQHRSCDEAVQDVEAFSTVIALARQRQTPDRQLEEQLRSVAANRGITIVPGELVKTISTQFHARENGGKYAEEYKTIRAKLDDFLAKVNLHPDVEPIIRYAFAKNRWMYVPCALSSMKNIYAEMVRLLTPRSFAGYEDCDGFLVTAHKGDVLVMSLTVWLYPDYYDIQEHALIAANIKAIVERSKSGQLALSLHAYAGIWGKRKYITANPLPVMRKQFRHAASQQFLTPVDPSTLFQPGQTSKCSFFGHEYAFLNDDTFQQNIGRFS
jgi:hypothetical protein